MVCTCTLWMNLFELQIAGQIRGNKYDITYIKRKGEGNKCMKNMQWAIISVPKTDGQTFLHKYRFIVRRAGKIQNLIYQNIYSWFNHLHFHVLRWYGTEKVFVYLYENKTIRKHLWHIYYTCICAIHIDEIINEYIRKVGWDNCSWYHHNVVLICS